MVKAIVKPGAAAEAAAEAAAADAAAEEAAAAPVAAASVSDSFYFHFIICKTTFKF